LLRPGSYLPIYLGNLLANWLKCGIKFKNIIFKGSKVDFLFRPEFEKTSFTKVVDLVEPSSWTQSTLKSELVCKSYSLRKFEKGLL
jgi:hypothetical protein